ncbi:hypothetical protein [Specibacter sp. RAF43]|uniref:hypothetical protein n=1 Tax=Specibacter sp. RAF43 TaxID=3233057 RepID=UPI003F959260
MSRSNYRGGFYRHTMPKRPRESSTFSRAIDWDVRGQLISLHDEFIHHLKQARTGSIEVPPDMAWKLRLLAGISGQRIANDLARCLAFLEALNNAFGPDMKRSPNAIVEVLDQWARWLECPSWLSEDEMWVSREHWLRLYDDTLASAKIERRVTLSIRWDRVRQAGKAFTRLQVVYREDLVKRKRLERESAKESQCEAARMAREKSQREHQEWLSHQDPEAVESHVVQGYVDHIPRVEIRITPDGSMGNREDYWPNERRN